MNGEGELCQLCGERYLTVYRVPPQIWEAVFGAGREGGLACPRCIDEETRELGIVLYWEAHPGVYPSDS